MTEDNRGSRPEVRLVLPGWVRFAGFWRAFGRGLGRASAFLLKMLKWPVLIAIPLFIFLFSAWWSLTTSLSSDVKTVPDLEHLTAAQAKEKLSFRSLKLAVSERREFSDWHDEATVLRQRPAADARIKRGRTVSVTLSSGPRKVLVPSLLGKSVREAKLVAQQKGFRLRADHAVYSDGVPEGRVVAQSPQPSTAMVTEFISILESRGTRPRVVMLPHLEGRPLGPVLEFLRNQGIKIVVMARGSDVEISGSELRFGRYVIYRQSPQAGRFLHLPSSEEVILRVERRAR